MNIREHYSLRALNTFGLEVKARYFCTLATLGGLRTVWQWQQQHPNLPVLFLGGGSNMLFVEDFPGLVVQIKLMERTIIGSDSEYTYVKAGAGENWHQFVRWTIDQGLAGLENLSLIPGTVGAAPMQNIGAYGVELKDHAYEVFAVDWKTAEMRHFSVAECGFGYRNSRFKSLEPNRWLIASVTFQLPTKPTWHLDYAGVKEHIQGEVNARSISDAIIAIRQSKLPDPAQLGNAGSFFKNPMISDEHYQALREQYPQLNGWILEEGVKVSAGWLIDHCGWKGKRIGDAGTYDQHALVLVNHGQATGAQIWQLALDIMDSVEQRFGIRLVPEPHIISGGALVQYS
ncbi:MAG: UDP-N-acetylmuramate dehydrogenase [Thiofilum sp.]|uniref:UDP-N-acetylmuramate dehydrogenase n=1 Tax=Thiofilum sp. TaxID=2212733 RepID=UPI0025CE9013|nr:UDP-N-acetylmuramate dehydrogenase [Thiofilum sp.]MBK8454417.1 UDP-N-acetylmuramate dehydrogenase [Thiofilum sp.]